MTEDALQASIVQWLKLQKPSLLWFSVPNGGKRNAREAAKLKRTGTLAGVADLVFVLPEGKVGFIEVKTEKGRQSCSQMVFHTLCQKSGAPYAIARSIEDVADILEEWGV